MPAALTYPGVYIQEVPSGVRTITGVATSITAFVGSAAAGPICTASSTDPPPTLTSFADYERRFGGLDVLTPMSYAVRDFYLNGGTMAVIVRVAHDDAAEATITLAGEGSPAEDLVLEASSVGEWGNRLSAAVDYDTDRALPRTSPPSTNPQRFNLTVRYRTSQASDSSSSRAGSVSTVDGDRGSPPLVPPSRLRARGACRPPGRPRTSRSWRRSASSLGSTPTPARAPTAAITDSDVIGDSNGKTGIHALNRVDLFNLLHSAAAPRCTGLRQLTPTSAEVSRGLCERRAMLTSIRPVWGRRRSRHRQRDDGRNVLT